MNIIDLKVRPSTIGFNTSQSNKREVLIIGYNATITYFNNTKKRIWIDTKGFKPKRSFKSYSFGKTFFIITDDEYHVYNTEGEEISTISLEEGELIKTSDQYFLLIKGITIAKYNDSGILVAQRTLSADEIDHFGKTKQLSLDLFDDTATLKSFTSNN